MSICCPAGHGCNASNRCEACALGLCASAADELDDAALAVSRWRLLSEVSETGGSQRRFRRRAYERARDRALAALALRLAVAPDGSVAASAQSRVTSRAA